MASITIYDLHPAGFDLFSDSEGYMNELGDSEFDGIYGGLIPALLFSAARLAAKRSSGACAKKVGEGLTLAGGLVSGWIVGD